MYVFTSAESLVVDHLIKAGSELGKEKGYITLS